jgi:glycosyltransferase involved in cell wall biosynthesis
MIEVSIIIPSLRQENIKKLAEFFEKIISVKYELIVISPYEIDGPNIVMVKEDKPKGIYRAVKEGLPYVKGDYILHMPDDACFSSGSLEHMINFSNSFSGRIFLGNWMVYNWPTVYEQGSYYDLPFSGFPFMKRKDLEKIGEFMDTHYDSFYGDPDLSLRVWDNNGIVALCPNAWMAIDSKMDDVKSQSLEKYEKSDKDKFIRRWKPIHGGFTGYQVYKHQVKGEPPRP